MFELPISVGLNAKCHMSKVVNKEVSLKAVQARFISKESIVQTIWKDFN